jgi:phosphoribosylamine--glycine ligase
MTRCGVPCASASVFTDAVAAHEYARSLEPPFVVKADGLAAGKGAIIAETHQAADRALEDMLVRRVFGDAGDRVVIEEFLSGREVSLLAFTDGIHVAPMVPSCDYKRAGDADQGPNTEGWAATAPRGSSTRPWWMRRCRPSSSPYVRAMSDAGHPFRGVLYAGLMVSSDNTVRRARV